MINKLRFFVSVLVMACALAAPVLAQDMADSVQNLPPYYLKDGVDFTKYDSVFVNELGVQDALVVAPPWVQGEDRSPAKWKLTDDDVKWLRESYTAAMREQISGKGNIPIVTRPGENVLMVDIEIVALMPYARKGEQVQTQGFGEVLVQAVLRDGRSGELLGIFEGIQNVGSEYQQNTRLNSEQSLRGLFDVWGARVRGLLEDRP